MGDPPRPNAVANDAASEGLSQLGARILNQLAISAWLPSAALVMLLAFVTQLGVAVENDSPTDWFDATMHAFARLGNMNAGSFFLLVAAVVVLTMLTQAFTFEAIRLLEGYWGTSRPLRAVAHAMCRHHRRRQKSMQERYAAVTKLAYVPAEVLIRTAMFGAFTEAQFVALQRLVIGDGSDDLSDPKHRQAVRDFDWTPYAEGELLRQRINVGKQLRDYPQPHHTMPTRLGNVLRRHEALAAIHAKSNQVESLVEDRFDSLPFSLRVSHDEQRGRLDLYCAMTLVFVVVGMVSAVQFILEHDNDGGWHGWKIGGAWEYGVWLAFVCMVGAWFSYRAAVASARYYGLLLLQIAKYPDPTYQPVPTTGSHPRPAAASGADPAEVEETPAVNSTS